MNLIQAIDVARGLLAEPLDSARTFPDDSSSFWTDTLLMSFFNMVQDEIQGEIVQADEMFFATQSFFSIQAGVAAYSLPSGCQKVIRIEDVRQSEPVEVRPCTINTKDQGGIFEGTTSVFAQGGYYFRGEQIVLTDTPNFTSTAAIQLHFARRLPELAAGTSISEIPPEYHKIFPWGIVKHALFSQQSDITAADKEYTRQMRTMKTNIESRQVQRPRKVKSKYND